MRDEYLSDEKEIAASQFLKEKEYWIEQFSGELTLTHFPYETPSENQEINETSGNTTDHMRFTIDSELTSKIETLTKDSNPKLHMVLMTGLVTLLHLYTDSNDITIGTPIDKQEFEGEFTNTVLPLRIRLAAQTSFKQLLLQIRQTIIKAIENQNYPIEALLKHLNMKLSDDGYPLFDAALLLEEIHDSSYLSHVNPNILLSFKRSDGNIQATVNYNTKLFEKSTIQRITNHFCHVLEVSLSNLEHPIDGIELLSEEEREQLLIQFNDTKSEYPNDKRVYQLFEEQVEKNPQRTALTFKDQTLTYSQLNIKKDIFAVELKNKGVEPDNVVGIMTEKSMEMVAAILGILKSGGAYLPLDIEYPEERKRYILKDSGIQLLLAELNLINSSTWQGPILNIKEIYNRLETKPHTPIQDTAEAFNLAYIIYTSGSTGIPKGVLIQHSGLTNYICWAAKNYISKDTPATITAFPLYTSISFDLTVTSIFTPLISGNPIVIYGETKELLVEKIIEDNLINTIKLTPTHLKLIREKYIGPNSNIKRMIVGGENFETQLANNIYQNFGKNIDIFNEYGPTEAVVGCMIYKFNPDKDQQHSVPIGKPADNVEIFLLGKNNLPVPPGIPGEIFISGDGIARGYLNRPLLTAEKFIILQDIPGKPSPNASTKKTKKLYRTGDLAKWLEGGIIEFLGRKDQQVKIRGNRIEIGEIENKLLKHDNIKEVVVTIRENQSGENYLCAYIVIDGTLSVAQAREYLSLHLPDYMIPSYIVKLDQFPIDAHGKLDRKALPAPEEFNINEELEYRPPRNQLEKIVVEIWENVLNRTNIGINENFFMIGGDSIRSIQIISRLNAAGYSLEMNKLFEYPVISDLAPHIKKIKRIPEQSAITGTYPLTPIQHRFFANNSIRHAHFNQAVMFYSKERYSEEAIRAIFKKIIEHHDVIRTTYSLKSRPLQSLNHNLDYPFSLEIVDLLSTENTEAVKILETKANEIHSGIDLENGPLMKLGLFQLNDGDRLLIVIHHLAVDGISWRILFEDIETLMDQYKKGEPLKLPLKTDSYKLWAEKLNEYANSATFLNEKEYWSNLESTQITEIKKDLENDENCIKDTSTSTFTLNKEETADLLTKTNEAFRTQINDILLTALSLAVKKSWGSERILISQEGHGRENIIKDLDISRTIGWYTSVFPVILEILPGAENNPGRQIKKIKEILRHIPHHGVGYGILKYLTANEKKEKISFQLKPQINFNYLGQFDTDVQQRGFTIAKETTGNLQNPLDQRNFDLEISGLISTNQLTMAVNYNKNHFYPETINRFLSNFKSILIEIIKFCSNRKHTEFTPSDFTYPSLSIETVEELTEKFPGQIQDIYLLTPMQQGMLFHSLYNQNSSAYFEQTAYRLHGQFNIEIVEKSLNILFKRHDILRTTFVYDEIETPVQVVLKDRVCDYCFEDITHLPTQSEKELYINAFREKDKHRSFNLSTDVLMRVTVIKVNPAEFELTWSFHHILMDGWCIGIINSEFFEVYNSLKTNRNYQLPEVAPYKSYIQWLSKQNKNESKSYWKTYLESYEEVAAIPRVMRMEKNSNTHCDETTTDYQDKHYQVIFDHDISSALNRISVKNHVTLNVISQSVWGILLGKYNGKEDVVFGSVVSGRPFELKGVESMVGLFINTIPVRIRFNQSLPFDELIQQIQAQALDGETHHYFPLAEIQAETVLKTDLIDHIFIFENFPVAQQIQTGTNQATTNTITQKPAWHVSDVNVYEQSNYDINIVLGMAGDQVGIRFDYNGNIFNDEFIEAIGQHFRQVMIQIAENDELEIGAITLITETEKKQILDDFNRTATPYPQDKTIDQLVYENTLQTPDQITIAGTNPKKPNQTNPTGTNNWNHISFKELEEKANKFSLILTKEGLKPGTIAAVMMERSTELIITLLAVLKSGAAYLPIDTAYPEERIKFILTDSKATIVVTNTIEQGVNNTIDRIVTPGQVSTIDFNCIENTGAAPFDKDMGTTMAQPQISQNPTNLAYIIYTSGSTGRPKGVMIDHRNALRLIKNSHYFTFPKDGRLLLTGTITFDITTFEIWGSILNSVRLYLVDQEIIMDSDRLYHCLNINHINILHLVPQLFNQLAALEINLFSVLDYFLVGGDLVKPKYINEIWKKFPKLQILHMYGPTENTTFSTFYKIDREFETKIPIGKPIGNSFAWVLDSQNRLQPIGVVGELVVGGSGIARGYLNNPELTDEKFFLWDMNTGSKSKYNYYFSQYGKPLHSTNPPNSPTQNLQAEGDAKNHLIPAYKTGDLARWHYDGTLEFLGRQDHQIKIRGIRIELEEIEKQLLEHSNISEAIVIVREETTNNDSAINTDSAETTNFLCAYIVKKREDTGNTIDEVTPLGLREYLQKKLPGFMIPAYFVILETLPLTSTGKVDRKVLPNPLEILIEDNENFREAGNELEKLLVTVWQGVLGRDTISIDDNFFMIGGDSIKAIQIVARTKKAGYTITVRDIFQQRTISHLAPQLKKNTREADQSVISGIVPLTPIQEEFFQTCKIHPHHFNQSMTLHTKFKMETGTITAVFKKLTEHHDALRMTFNRKDDKIIQTSHNLEYPFEIQELDLQNEQNPENQFQSICDRIQSEIDLENGPMLKLGLFHLKGEDRLLIVVHHLVMDAVSWRILLEDIETLYRYYQNNQQNEQDTTTGLPLKTDSFKLWAEKLIEYAQSDEIRQQLPYWQSIETTPVAPIPIDNEPQSEQKKIKFNTAERIELTREQTVLLLEKANQAYNTEINDLLLSALALSFHRWYNCENILVNLEGHGREEIIKDLDITRTVGWYTSKYPVLLKLPNTEISSDDGFISQSIKMIKEQLRAIPSRGIGYGILRYLTPNEQKQNLCFTKNPEINFNYLGEISQTNETPHSEASTFIVSDRGAELTNSMEQEDQYKININSMIINGQFVLMLGYNQHQYSANTIQTLSIHFKETLERILQHCTEKDTTEKTLSDFSAKMDQNELDDIYDFLDDLL